jgi:chromosome segregation ATPase
METDQITKQLNWLDEERRKDKNTIGTLDERVNEIELKITNLEHNSNDLESQITRLNTLISKIDGFEESLLTMRVDSKQQIDEYDKISKKREEEAEKVRRTELRSIETSITEIRKEMEQLPDMKRNLKNRVEEELRLSRTIDELRNRLDVIQRSEEEYSRTVRGLEDGRRQDSKRITDLTGEVSAIRKRADEYGGRLEIASSSLKKMETRLNELGAAESERREAITNFLDSQSLREVERERLWKEWQVRFEQLESQAKEIESTLQALDAMQRAVKRSQELVDDVSQKVERRTNEMTEIQRLGEERFRQEWATFKADDQKRWTNYILTMEEQRNEGQRQHEKLAEKVTQIEDELQEMKDLVQQANEHTEKRLQGLLAITHEWVSSYERTVGRTR